MAAAKKRMSKKELKAAPEIQNKLETTFDFITKYRYPIIGGISAVLILYMVAFYVIEYMGDRKVEVGGDLWKVVGQLDAPIKGAEDDSPGLSALAPSPDDNGVVYTSEEEKLGAIDKGLDEFLGNHGSSDAAVAAKLAKAVVADQQGKPEAATLYNELSTSSDLSAIKPVLLQKVASEKLALGKYEEVETIATGILGGNGAPSIKAIARGLLGDAYNPMFGATSAFKNKDKAKGQYEEAIKLLTPEEGKQLPSIERSLKKELELKLDLLAMAK